MHGSYPGGDIRCPEAYPPGDGSPDRAPIPIRRRGNPAACESVPAGSSAVLSARRTVTVNREVKTMSRSLKLLPIALLLLAVSIGCRKVEDHATMKLHYPPAHTVDVVDDYHGTKVADPYRWLENPDSADTRAWIEAENKLTRSFLDDIPVRAKIKQRLTELWNYPKYGAPVKEGGRYFFSKNDGLQNQSVLYVQDSLDGQPRVLLDPNKLSADGTVALGGMSISHDGKLLAWATNVSGSDWRTWYVRDIDTGKDLPDKIEWSKFSGASWDKRDRGFYYSRYDAPAAGQELEQANYYQKLYYHKVGTPQSQDVLVYQRPDHKDWGFGGDVTEDGRYLIISVWKGASDRNALFYKDLTRPGSKVVELLTDFDAQYRFVGHDDDVFYLQTDKDAPRGRLVAMDITDPAQNNWFELIPESEMTLQDVSMINGDEFVATFMKDAHSVVRRFDHHGRPLGEIALPGIGTVSGVGGHRQDTETFYTYTSFLAPPTIYHYDFTTGKSTVFRKPELKFDFSPYTTEQVFATSKDGTRVPIFLVHRKDAKLDGRNPTLLYGYGGFNISLTPYFSISRLAWVEMGGVFAMATLRGGGEYGQKWHEAGMLANKQNVFDDFIAAARYLIDSKWTSTPKLAIQGGSNGGLLVGAVVDQQPGLFGAALPAVGVMDMLRYQKFTIGWAWVPEYGSSDDPEQFRWLYRYSPYHNIKAGTCYPAVLATTADHDDRVVPGHTFKYIARLQAAQGCDNPILVRIETKAGHGGGKPTDKIIDEITDQWAFLWKVLGMGQ